MIYILEGPDGTGKTTLANEIAEVKKASVLHSYFDIKWDIQRHHKEMWDAARSISKWRPVVLDRWAPSEFVYGTVFRGKPGYDTQSFMWELDDMMLDVIWIYCRNDNAVENHMKNKAKRQEMFDDMAEVVKLFDYYISDVDSHEWIEYDFNKVDMHKFVKELPGENFAD